MPEEEKQSQEQRQAAPSEPEKKYDDGGDRTGKSQDNDNPESAPESGDKLP